MSPSPQPPDDATIHAYLHLQMRAMLFLRASSSRLTGDQIFDLADALHNLPEFIWSGFCSDDEYRRIYLLPYDAKWAQGPDAFSLAAALREGFRRHESRG